MKWLAAVNLLESGEFFKKFDVNIIRLVNLVLNWLDPGSHLVNVVNN